MISVLHKLSMKPLVCCLLYDVWVFAMISYDRCNWILFASFLENSTMQHVVMSSHSKQWGSFKLQVFSIDCVKSWDKVWNDKKRSKEIIACSYWSKITFLISTNIYCCVKMLNLSNDFLFFCQSICMKCEEKSQNHWVAISGT